MTKILPAQSVSLNFFAPTWRILGNKIINLCGLAGVPGAHGINPGEDGQPGGPGGNSGIFYGKGVNFVNLNQLTLNLTGGRGGAGGNGVAGSPGANGVDGNPALRTRSQGNMHYYQDQGTDGQPGQNGGQGGHGGIGGHKGWSVIDGAPWNSISVDGVLGTVGNAATGGAGGLHGKHCQGTYETGRTTQQAYTAYRPVNRTRRVYSHQTTRYETRTREESYQAPVENSPWWVWVIPGAQIGKAIEGIANAGQTETRYRTVTDHHPIVTTHYKDEDYTEQEAYTAYRTDPLPDVWNVPQGLQGPRGLAPVGNLGNGLNVIGQQNPIAQTILDRNNILPPYRAEYQQGTANPLTVNFAKDFPNL